MQTIERIWIKGGTLTAQTDAGARAWVLKISKNKGRDWLRRRVKDQGLDSDLDDERTDLPYRQPQFEEAPFERHTFYTQLSAREREVAERLAQGYRDVDIAQELDLSKTRVHQLKQQIAEKLNQFLSAE